jgi:quercetin dioxygenase-like cupin family protein
MEGVAEEVTLAIDKETGDYTKLTRFKPGADTSSFGSKSHEYPEEIMIIEGRLYDEAFDRWLEVGDYASRPPGEVHGPFRTDSGCVVLEISYPSQSVGGANGT